MAFSNTNANSTAQQPRRHHPSAASRELIVCIKIWSHLGTSTPFPPPANPLVCLQHILNRDLATNNINKTADFLQSSSSPGPTPTLTTLHNTPPGSPQNTKASVNPIHHQRRPRMGIATSLS